jgi:hypothetical protein
VLVVTASLIVLMQSEDPGLLTGEETFSMGGVVERDAASVPMDAMEAGAEAVTAPSSPGEASDTTASVAAAVAEPERALAPAPMADKEALAKSMPERAATLDEGTATGGRLDESVMQDKLVENKERQRLLEAERRETTRAEMDSQVASQLGRAKPAAPMEKEAPGKVASAPAPAGKEEAGLVMDWFALTPTDDTTAASADADSAGVVHAEQAGADAKPAPTRDAGLIMSATAPVKKKQDQQPTADSKVDAMSGATVMADEKATADRAVPLGRVPAYNFKTPEDWLKAVDKLLDEKKFEDAKKSLEAFVIAYPDYKLDEKYRALLPKESERE